MEENVCVVTRKKGSPLLRIARLLFVLIGITGIFGGISLAALQNNVFMAVLVLGVSIVCIGLAFVRLAQVTCPKCQSTATVHTFTADFECRACLTPTVIKWEKE
ncbi:hypothetical protein [Shouchella lonarensis]|uniref:Zinc-ribbon containing domain-containing protein n=1 Tax=Shouchella lonarensis TaxID=1464122 RepID=A0A1G6GL81_9BACI|nr:hypothetical protein [Shouchella lonarensis]SDB81926.1 hypothetical protein SAMN05421737_101125 [Shouchella lonarensis]